jgi:hypothetical protein
MPPRQTVQESMTYLEPAEAVQLCRSLRLRGPYLYYAAVEKQDEKIGADDHQILGDGGYGQATSDRGDFNVLTRQ